MTVPSVPRAASLLALTASLLVPASTAVAAAPGEVLDDDPAVLTYTRAPSSAWDVRIDTAANTVVATHAAGPSLTVDYDDLADDNHRAGITPDLGCGPLEGSFFAATTPFLYPILDPARHHIQAVDVQAGTSELRVLMSGGSYRFLDPAADDEPLFTDARFTVENGELHARLAGLYYLLPSKNPTTKLRLRTEAGATLIRDIDLTTPSAIEYIDDVRSIDVKDGAYGRYELTSDIERLQIQTNSTFSPRLTVFELDSDHTFKDLGQKVVHTAITFEKPACHPA